MNNASIYGWLRAPHAPGMQIEQLAAPVTLDEGTIHIADGLVSNASLGATVSGDVNLEKKTLSLDGTIIPPLRSIPRRATCRACWLAVQPRKERRCGLSYLSGHRADGNPSVHVNPYAMLLPGFLRNVMHIH